MESDGITSGLMDAERKQDEAEMKAAAAHDAMMASIDGMRAKIMHDIAAPRSETE